MIITETEWNQAAVVHGGDQEAPSHPPSYNDTMIQRPRLPPRSPRPSASPNPDSPNVPLGESSSTQNSPAAEEVMRCSFPSPTNPSAQGPILYVFVQNSFNSMVLTYQPATLPVYHISTHTNCFIPSSYITVIRRGDSEAGVFVGQFEMGISVKKSTITLDGKEKLTDAVLQKYKSRSDKYYLWRWSVDESSQLSWSMEGPAKYCFLGNGISGKRQPIACYTPPPLTPRADGRPSPPPSLKMYPEGASMFDHIVISALIIERHRLTPSSSSSVQSWSL